MAKGLRLSLEGGDRGRRERAMQENLVLVTVLYKASPNPNSELLKEVWILCVEGEA